MKGLKQEISEVLVELLLNKKKKVAKTPKFVLVVNSTVLQSKLYSKKDLIKATRAIIIRNPEARIKVYKYQGDINVNLPVNITEKE